MTPGDPTDPAGAIASDTEEGDDTEDGEVQSISFESDDEEPVEDEVLGIELLPETGADSDLLVVIALSLLILGAAFVWVANGEDELTAV